jgi:hypothetical protein
VISGFGGSLFALEMYVDFTYNMGRRRERFHAERRPKNSAN